MASEEKKKALDAALAQIERQYGKGSVMKLGDSGNHMNIETIPSGALSLDLALGLGGFPKGRIIEIYGPESSGKTTVALHAVAEVQKQGGIAGFIDADHALDTVYAKNIGVDIDNLYISQPDNGEQALEITETMVRSGAVDIVIVDSVAALVPKAEIDGEMGDAHVGLQARLMSQALRKLTSVISKSNCIVIFINQLREKVGIMFGNPETTTGGRALSGECRRRATRDVLQTHVVPHRLRRAAADDNGGAHSVADTHSHIRTARDDTHHATGGRRHRLHLAPVPVAQRGLRRTGRRAGIGAHAGVDMGVLQPVRPRTACARALDVVRRHSGDTDSHPPSPYGGTFKIC